MNGSRFSNLCKPSRGKALSAGMLLGLGALLYKGPHFPNKKLRLALSGMFGALVPELLLYPLDTINMRAKAQAASNTYTLTRAIWQKEGLQALYRGSPLILKYYAPGFFVYYFLYETLRQELKPVTKSGVLSALISSLGGAAVAELMFVVLMYPFEFAKTRKQVPDSSLATSFHQGAWKNGNKNCWQVLRRHYRGVCPYLGTFVAFTGLQFAGYSALVSLMASKDSPQDDERSNLTILIASALSGVIASVLTNPLELLTVQRQTKNEDVKFKSLSMSRLLDGLTARIWYNSLSSIALFLSLEHFAGFFGVRFNN